MGDKNGAAVAPAECISTIIPGWFSKISPMWPGKFPTLFTHIHTYLNELSLDDKFLVQATKLFNEIKYILSTSISSVGSGMPEEVERYWFAFVLYSVKRLSDEREADNSNGGSGENGFTLCQILRAAKLNIVDFFKELPQFIVKVGVILRNLYGADWEKRLEFHYGVFFAYMRLREQEIRNLMWISECVAQNQKSRVHDSVVFIF
ncbi:Uncharacterized protein Fot_11976 [Forsythia ovata]|uniref:Retinoblastoma-associated protein N-terminal domain-containing protein n=1 Tax=Forsythia ovata TaxID=205694 RepID=A0ABD1WLK5_9LAMI